MKKILTGKMGMNVLAAMGLMYNLGGMPVRRSQKEKRSARMTDADRAALAKAEQKRERRRERNRKV